MKKSYLTTLFISAFFIIAGSPLFAKSKMIPITEEWEFQYDGDNELQDEIEDEDEESEEEPKVVTYKPACKIPNTEKREFWLNATIQIPEELMDETVYFEMGQCSAATEVYIDGILMGGNGTITPKITMSHGHNTIVLIPDEVKSYGEVEIAIKCKSQFSHISFNQFYLVNKDRYYKVVTAQNFLNTTVYYMMAAMCLIFGLYFIFQRIADHSDKASLYFGLSLITIAIYFFDMATDLLLFPANVQIALSRLCLVASVGFLVLFIQMFMNRSIKILMIVVYSVLVVFAVAYVISMFNYLFHGTLFTLSMIPIFSGIIYLYVILAKSTKEKKNNAKILMIGISFAMIFGVHDIIYQASGHIPFAWLQGFAFFFIDITMLVVVTLETITNKKRIHRFAVATMGQKNKLDAIISNAKELSLETMNIANMLNESVNTVAQAAAQSEKQTAEIGEFISLQNSSVRNTSESLSNLVDSVHKANSEISNESDIVNSTVTETTNLIAGVNQVTETMENAANFTKALGELTQKSTEDVTNLTKNIDYIKEASAQILGIVNIVSEFSRKTNMLAMNASIEAAHSGAAGKGFAVIAHEINSLAGASAAQANKINDIVTEIDSHINQSVELSRQVKTVLDQVSKEAEETSKSVNETVNNLEIQKKSGERISEATTLMSNSAENVKLESENQYSYARQASSSMKELSKYAEQAEIAVEDIIKNNKELADQTASLLDLAKRAKETSEGLDKLIHG